MEDQIVLEEMDKIYLMNSDYELINTYLWYSYLPTKDIPAWIDDCITPENKGSHYTPQEAAKLFDRVFDELLKIRSEGKHIIPLSGGFDSRAILGALLERLDSSQIETVSFGAPGQLDYDVGLKVAKWAGVKHHALDLRTVDFSWDKIVDSVNKSPWTGVPDGYFNQLAMNLVEDRDKIIWSGFLNDAITGGHLSSAPLDFRTQRQSFIEHERRARCLYLCDSKFDVNSTITKNKPDTELFMDDALLFGLHCTNYTTPINLPGMTWKRWSPFIEDGTKDLRFIAPFIDETWAGYWFSAPREVRKGQKLYLEMLKMKFPELFSLPGKKSLGFSDDERLRFHVRRIYNGAIRRLQKKAPWLRIRSKIGINYLDY